MAVETTMMAHNSSSDANALAFMFRKLMSESKFIELVTVEEVDAEAKTCKVKPLIIPVAASGVPIDVQPVSDIPYFRLQMGGAPSLSTQRWGTWG